MFRTILIVDDVMINRKILISSLSKEYTAIEAENGQEALKLMNSYFKTLSAVLLDINMPVMDGYEVLRRRQGNLALSQIPVIVVTGFEDEATRVKALSLGANDFVTKPCNPDILKHCLRNNIALRETATIVNAIQRDKLTGIYNREFFFAKAGELIKEHEPGYYIMGCMDIDHFKLINDQLSPVEGDRILRHVGDYLRSLFEEVQGICGRISGDNFAALFPNNPEVIDMITSRHEERLLPANIPTSINFSLGRCVVSDTSLPVSAIYDRAYIAKQSIKGRYDAHIAIFDESMLAALLREQEIVGEMDKALAERQFEVWFQPQYNHSTGAHIGAEALARWRHPVKGNISPGDFIPVFERNGFVYELDKFIWEATCQYLHKWIAEGRTPLPVSVNISRYDIFRPDLVAVITGLVRRYHVPVELLRLEITESAFATSTKHIVRIVKELVDYGFTIEIDDFGSGYSSLNTLKDVPAQIIKLDMRFLSESDDSQRGGNILESIVRMAKWLGMAVIAEGVETIEQADFLKTVGCSYMQGYLYARPMPADDYEALCVTRGGEQRLFALETINNLDSNTFWNPQSLETLIFNTYVGGACIFEYRNRRIEMIRVNDKYARSIGGENGTPESALAIVWADHMDNEAAAVTQSAIERAIDTGEDVTCEAAYHGLFGAPGKTYLRTTFRLIAHAQDRYLFYATNENITSQRVAEQQREEASLALREVAERMQSVMDGVDQGITAMLIENDAARYLFSNNRYYEIMGYTREQFEAEALQPFSVVHPDDRARMGVLAHQVSHGGEPVVAEYRALKRDGSVIWVQSTMSAGHFSGERDAVLLTMYRDITEDKRAEEALHDTDEMLRMLNETAHDLLAQPDCDAGLQSTLIKMRDYFQGSCAHIFEVGADGLSARCTYEASAPGTEGLPDAMKRMPREVFMRLREVFTRDGYVHIDDISALDDAWEDKAQFAQFGITRLISVPLMRDGTLIGFVGVNNPVKQYSRIDQLIALGDYVAVMLTRRDLNARIQHDNERLHGLLDDMPGGYMRLKVRENGSVTPVFVNRGLQSLLGVGLQDLCDRYAEDPMSDVHPDDLDSVRFAHEKLRNTGEAQSPIYRLRAAGGTYVWVRYFARKTRDEAGAEYLNIYYTDASEQKRTDEMRNELLDNLPCGAGLLMLQNGNIAVAHLNRRFYEMLSRPYDESLERETPRIVHPDDELAVRGIIHSAFENRQPFECDIRLLDSDSRPRLFHMNGRVMAREDGTRAVYTVFLPITDEAIAMRDMLPVMLEAMMASQTDYMFVKDKDLRYVCCSRAFARMTSVGDEKRVVGLTDYDLFDKELADQYVADDRRLLSGGQSLLNYTEAIPSLDGSRGSRRANTSKYLLHDSRGDVIGLYGVSRDITELLERESRLALLIDSIRGGVAAFEGTLTDPRLTYYSDGFYRLFGYDREAFERLDKTDILSFVLEEDRDALKTQIVALAADDKPLDAACRVRANGGKLKWVNIRAVVGARRGDRMTVHTVCLDISRRQSAMERLRISEEEFRLAALHSGGVICRYSIADQTVTVPHKDNSAPNACPNGLEGAPGDIARSGVISPETAQDYISLFKRIERGEPSGSAMYQSDSENGWRWMEAFFTTIFTETGKPTSAVISVKDVTQRREQEAVYQRWQQSLQDRHLRNYTLMRGNISQNTAFSIAAGALMDGVESARTYDEQIAIYCRRTVFEDDAEAFMGFLKSDALLAKYHRGKRSDTLEYRENTENGACRWLRLSVDLMQHPNSSDVEAYLMLENIDKRKRTELITRERAETDPLTGVLNRATFAARMDRLADSLAPDERSALLMLDIDGFKMVNDVFGHGAGDQALVDIASSVRAVLRRGDLLGRLGGDEFVIFLRDVSADAVIAQKARQLCATVRKAFSVEVQISGSIGIAVCPRDGAEFETLYKKADNALYHVKDSGRDNFAFYQDDMTIEPSAPREEPSALVPVHLQSRKRRMLIVDDSLVDAQMLSNLFEDEFFIERARDGNTALVRIRHYGAAISVVLLDLVMPGMDGFAVLRKMRENPELQSIPVIVVSGTDDRETSLESIRMGASDFINKPVDADLLRLRVRSAVSKAENERLRAKNSFLELQNNESLRYKTVFEHIGVCVVEHDWVSGTFTYDAHMSEHIAGTYDGRGLWHILLADMVADTMTVKTLQEFVHTMAESREPLRDSIVVSLKTPQKTLHRFTVNVIKRDNEFGLTDKLYLILYDIGA